MDTEKGKDVEEKECKDPIALINEDGALFWYARDWYPTPNVLFEQLVNTIEWEIRIGSGYGKVYTLPRLTYHMGDKGIGEYASYGGSNAKIHGWHPELEKLKNILQTSFDCYLDTCLLNYYVDGKQYIAYHGDKESVGSRNITIGLSLGSSRDLVFKRNSDGHTISFENRSGDLYVMEGTIHKLWKHSVPKRLRVKDGRISATFRQIMPDEFHVKKTK
tara:strand:+ start:228 stop:881 length:654 start_codon:yes stop_codon:yes gene_type:complete